MNRAADGISGWNREEVQCNLTSMCSDISWKVLSLWAKGKELCSGILESDSFDTPLPSRFNALSMGIWIIFGLVQTEPEQARSILEPRSSPNVHSRELVAYIAYACMSKSLQRANHRESLLAINLFHHRIAMGIELETARPVVAHALKAVPRCDAVFGTQLRLRRPLSWSMLRAGGSLTPR